MFPIKIKQKEERIVAYKSISIRKEMKTYSMNDFNSIWIVLFGSLRKNVNWKWILNLVSKLNPCSISSKKELSKKEWIKLFGWVLFSFHSNDMNRYHSIWFGISSVLRTLYEFDWDLRREWKKGLWTKFEMNWIILLLNLNSVSLLFFVFDFKMKE